MRPDESRFHLLLGEEDWGRCAGEGAAAPLATVWTVPLEQRPLDAPAWDSTRAALTLPPMRDLAAATQGENPLSPADRLGAAADAAGNIYWIGRGRTHLFVRSAGTGRASAFWPDPRSRPAESSLFGDAAPPAPPPPRLYTALAATEEGWLVAAWSEAGWSEPGRRGLACFDLVGGGEPVDRLWPAGLTADLVDLAPACCGGLFVLDGAHRLFELDRRLDFRPAVPAVPEPDLFQPATGPARAHGRTDAPLGRDLSALEPGAVPVAIQALPGGALAILARTGAAGRLFVLPSAEEAPSDALPLPFIPHDLAFGAARLRDEGDSTRLIVTGGSGNDAIAFTISDEGAALALRAVAEIFPLRRYSGQSLVSVRGALHYASTDAPAWVPVVERPRIRYAERASFITPPLDARTPQTVWDRLRIDGCVPPGATLSIEGRSADSAADLASHAAEWRPQPRPLLSPTGGELAGYGPSAIPATDPARGRGSFELLLQGMRGRFLQLRLTLTGDAGITPHLRALRAWYPRQSLPERYLPAVYRMDPAAGDFLERFLANMEGTVTGIERRIADAQALFDPRTAPAETLDWLASWFDVALDPSWEEARRRFFIANAVRFFAMRGTLRGVEAALSLWQGGALDERLFTGGCAAPSGIRVVESFLSRRSAGAAAGGGRDVWTPAEGNVGLADRIARAAGQPTATADRRAQPVPLYAAGTERERAAWPALAAERTRWHQHQVAAGTNPAMADLPRDHVPDSHRDAWTAFTALASRDRRLWQDLLRSRYGRIARLNAAHEGRWTAFEEISLPDRLPAAAAAQEDWLTFETKLLPMGAAAHRFTVLLPVKSVSATPGELARLRAAAARIVALEKPAHTVFDIRFFFAMNRIGEARVGVDMSLGQGSRAPELVPPAVLGSAYVGASFVGPDGTGAGDGRRRLQC
jgi:phage tail-like protein